MNSAPKAAFLSYASQDAEAARRICDTLRSAGLEVWFDAEGGLEHGDEWDAKIRRQIKECVLFIPVISANTQARLEGYFRIEWELAADRAMGIAAGVPFILPIVIDDTHDADALVPDRFRKVQWTRLRGGEVPADVRARLVKLWCHRTGVVSAEATRKLGSSHPGAPGLPPLSTPRSRSPMLVVGGIAAVLAIGAGVAWKLSQPETTPAAKPATAAGATTEADRLTARAIAMLERVNYTRDDLAAAEVLARKATDLAPESADAWAARAFVQAAYVYRSWDRSEARLQDVETSANRALAFDAKQARALLALAELYSAQRAFGQAESIARRAIALQPDTPHLYRVLAGAVSGQGRDAEAAALYQENVRRFPRDPLTHYGLANAQIRNGKYAAAMESLETALAIVPFTSARTSKTRLLIGWKGDLVAAREMLEQIPPEERTELRAIGTALWLGLLERRLDRVQAAAALTAQTYLTDAALAANGPKAMAVALVFHAGGKETLARHQWQAAETAARNRLRERPGDLSATAHLAISLVRLGRNEEAAREIAPCEAAAREQPESPQTPAILLARYYASLGDAAEAVAFLRINRIGLEATPPLLALDPWWDKIRDHPAFTTLVTEAKARAAEELGTTELPRVAPAGKSVAVLAFANLSDDKSNEYFSDGISEELLTILQKIPGLRVAARTSAFSFKAKKDLTTREVGEKLGVAHVVDGSVQKIGSRVKITARLSRASTNEELWSQGFGPLELTDVFATQAEIAQAIVGELRGRLTGETATAAKAEIQAQVRAAQKGGTKNADAHQLYLQAKFFLNQLTAPAAIRASGLLHSALKLDPEFALGWAALSHAGWVRGGFGDTKEDFDEGMKLAREAADRAVELEPNLAAAHLARSDVLASYDFNWKAAEQALRRAASLAPNDPAVIAQAAILATAFGQPERGVELHRQAIALDPVNPHLRIQYGYTLTCARRYEEAQAEFQRVIEFSPAAPWGHGGVSLALTAQGRFAQAAAAAEKEKTTWARLCALAIARWGEQQTSASDAALAELLQSYAEVAAVQIAWVYAFRGDNDRAFEWLERAYRQRDGGLTWTRSNFILQNLHADPRWPAFLKKLGLSDEQLK